MILREIAAFAVCLTAIADARCQVTGQAKTPRQDPAPQTIGKGDIARAVDEYLAANPPVQRGRPWERILADIQFYGDLRLRHETDTQRVGRRDRHRQRMRLRLGFDHYINDELTLGARIVTGDPADPNSPHVSFGDAFNRESLALDRAYLRYQPQAISGLSITAGKFNDPFARNPVYGELVWDADVQPEGLFATYNLQSQKAIENFAVTAGVYPVLEYNTDSETFISVVEARGRVRFSDRLVSDMSIGYHLYSGATPAGRSVLLDDNAGNETIDRNGDVIADAFASHFGILHPIATLTYDAGGAKLLTVAAEYMRNLRAEDGADQGYAIGISYGNMRRQGDWWGYYQWQVVEREAVFSAFAQDDFLLATNHRSHIFGVNYQLLDTTGLHLYALASAPDEASAGPLTNRDHYQWRFRIDLNVRF
ncbi:MAG: hypothetical protein ACI91B_004404 [Planctomycetota bacterium]|jgi:hypothetical protein